MVDWSGSDRRLAGSHDCIWIAYGRAAAVAPTTVSPPSRTEAEQVIRAQLQPIVAARRGRVLLCADFGYGYPAGFASLLPTPSSSKFLPWRIVWHHLGRHVQDDLGTSRANARAIAAIVSRPQAPLTPRCRVRLRAVHSGVFSKPVLTLASRKKSHRSRSSAPVELSLPSVSRIRERKAIRHFVSSAPVASAAKCSPASHESRAFGLIPSSSDAPLFGLSRRDGRPRPAYGSTPTCGFCTPRFIPASELLSPISSTTAVRCAPCGIGRATSTQAIY